MRKLLVFLFGVFVMCVSSDAIAIAADMHVTVMHVEGTVTVTQKVTGQIVDAYVAMQLQEGDRIDVAVDSFCEVALGEALQNIISINENTTVVVESRQPTIIELPNGRVFSLIKNLEKGSQFQIRTPTAIAGVRGTGLGVAFSGGITQAESYERTIYVKGVGGGSGQKQIPQGFQTTIGSDGSIPPAFKLTNQKKRMWQIWKQSLPAHRAQLALPLELLELLQ